MFGLYDSGLGGLTVLAALRAAGLTQDIIYFADQAHAPYGDRDAAGLYALLAQNLALLERYGVDAVVMACNTSCAVAAQNDGFPPAPFAILDLIANAVTALREMRVSNVAVLATLATVRSGAYRRAIAVHAPQIEVHEIAAPALVPLIEQGLAATPQAADAVRAICRKLPPEIDAIVYGCTHYPLLDGHFANELDSAIVRIDPAFAQAAAARVLAKSLKLAAGNGRTHYLTNGDLALFKSNVRRWTGERSGTFEAVTIRCERSQRS